MRSWLGDLQGVSKGGSNAAVRCLKKLVCFPFWPSGESEDRTEGPQLLLCLLSCQHKKVGPPGRGQTFSGAIAEYEAAIKELELSPVDVPKLDVKEIGSGKDLVMAISVTVKPEFELGEYKGIKVQGLDNNVTEAEKTQEQNRYV